MAPGRSVRNQTTDWQRNAEAVVGVGETASTSAPASFRGIHTSLPGPDQPEVTMWNAEFKPGTNGSDLPEAEVHPKSEPLSPKTRLEAIASILALAVLRRRVRTAASPVDRAKIEESGETSEKDLIRGANRAFMPDKRVQNGSSGVTHE